MDWGFVAEDADAYQELPRLVERDARASAVLIHGPTSDIWSNLGTRVRFTHDQIDAPVANVRAWFVERSIDEFRWLIGPSATPQDVLGALRSSGARRDEAEPELTAMVLDRAPPPVAGVPIREVKSQSDFAEMERIHRTVFADASTSTEELAAGWAALSDSEGSRAFLAELDGQAVAYGVMRRTDPGPWLLAGSVTLPGARGGGAYRALVRAHREVAITVGAPVLVTRAQTASRPILERIGFEPAGAIAVLIDQVRGIGEAAGSKIPRRSSRAYSSGACGCRRP